MLGYDKKGVGEPKVPMSQFMPSEAFIWCWNSFDTLTGSGDTEVRYNQRPGPMYSDWLLWRWNGSDQLCGFRDIRLSQNGDRKPMIGTILVRKC